jgi:hypothetical protein
MAAGSTYFQVLKRFALELHYLSTATKLCHSMKSLVVLHEGCFMPCNASAHRNEGIEADPALLLTGTVGKPLSNSPKKGNIHD